MEYTPTGAFLFIAILIIMYSNKNFSSEVPAGLQDIMYISNQHVRTIMINGEPWFVAKDVCDILDIKNPSDTLRKVLSDWEKGIEIVYTHGGPQQMGIVNESGLYHLIFVSRKPEAEAFRRWVTQDLIPSIRKTGRYEIGTPKRRRLLPRDRKEIDPNFWTEIRKYVLPKDIRDVAARMNVTLRHAQKVLAGTVTSYPVMEQFVVIGASNRANGIMRPEARHYEQLVFQFIELDGKEG